MFLEVETEPLDLCSWMVKSLLRETCSDTTCCIIDSNTPKRGGVNWVYNFLILNAHWSQTDCYTDSESDSVVTKNNS
jgi:hypothetical protein